MLNPSIKQAYPELFSLYIKYSEKQLHQFEKFTIDLIDILLKGYAVLNKNNLQDYFVAELNNYTTLFPEFSAFNKENRLSKSGVSIAKDLDLKDDTLDPVSTKKLYAFLVNRAVNLTDFFSINPPEEILPAAQIFSVDSDFHWYAERPFVLKRGGESVVVKPNRGMNTVLLGQLIKIFEIEKVAAVPNTSYVGTFELQEFIGEDRIDAESGKMSFNWGRLISFSWLLGMRDYHYENIKISSGKFVLCDNEIILSPRLEKSAYMGRRDSEFVQMIQESVVGTNLLPTRFPEHCNLKGINERGAVLFNALSSDIESVVKGFKYQNRINWRKKNAGLEAIKLLLNKLKIRCVFRPTNFYAKLLWRASLSKTYFDSEPYNFQILNALNKFPKEYEYAYFNLCEQERMQLELGSFPIFHHGNQNIDRFFRPISMEGIDSAFSEKLALDQEHLLKLCLSVNKELDITTHVEEGASLLESYLNYHDKTVFKNGADNFTRLLSLAYMPSTNEHTVGPIDDGLYNGLAGIISVYPLLSKVGELHRLCDFYFNHGGSSQALADGLSSGGAGVASAILSGRLCLERNLSGRVLELIEQRKNLLRITDAGIFEPQNGIIYTGLLALSLLNDEGSKLIFSLDYSSPFFNNPKYEEINLGLSHGFVGSQFLKSWYENETETQSKANNLNKWREILDTDILKKNGICGGIDGLVLVISKLQIRYGGYESLSTALSDALLQSNMLDNKWLCHGYMGQIWSRYIFDLAFGSNTLSHFEVKKRTNQIINEVKQALLQKKLLDISLFNGAMGVLAIDRILNYDCKPTSSMHIFPSFN
jgi:hypothetical protein